MFFETLSGIKADLQRSHGLDPCKCQHTEALPLSLVTVWLCYRMMPLLSITEVSVRLVFRFVSACVIV